MAQAMGNTARVRVMSRRYRSGPPVRAAPGAPSPQQGRVDAKTRGRRELDPILAASHLCVMTDAYCWSLSISK